MLTLRFNNGSAKFLNESAEEASTPPLLGYHGLERASLVPN